MRAAPTFLPALASFDVLNIGTVQTARSRHNESERTNSDTSTRIHDMVRNGHVGPVEALLRRCPEALHIQDSRKQTPLHIAASSGHLEMVKFLLRSGADPDKRDCDGWTSLHAACVPNENVIKVVELLIYEAGADFKALTNSGNSILHYLAEFNAMQEEVQLVDLFEFLAKSGLSMNHQNSRGDTPLHRATMCSKVNNIIYLLKFGAKPNIRNKRGYTPLHYAIMGGELSIAEVLILGGADVSLCAEEVNDLTAMLPKDTPFNEEMKQLLQTHLNKPLYPQLMKKAQREVIWNIEIVDKVKQMGYPQPLIFQAIYELIENREDHNDLDTVLDKVKQIHIIYEKERAELAFEKVQYCSICMDKPINCVLLPCGHASFCCGCAEEQMRATSQCPICRTSIQQVKKIFLV
jgi:ankyrin repeat protein